MNQPKVREAIGIAMGVITLIPIDENECPTVSELLAHSFDLLVDAHALIDSAIEQTGESEVEE
jgi:hypothetical protein